MKIIELLHGDCLEIMKSIPDKSIDLVLTDPPYGTTACKWDTVIPFEPMWKELKRIRKDNAAIVLFGSEPFSSHLRMSNIKEFRYDWYWNKRKAANFLFMNKQPGKIIEIASSFYAKQPTYYSQKTINPKGASKKHLSPNPTKINDHVKQLMKTKQTMEGRDNFWGSDYEPDKLLANCLLEFKKEHGFHPTQKPVALLEYLIKTYTLEGETVLDFTMGSGSTGVAAKILNR